MKYYITPTTEMYVYNTADVIATSDGPIGASGGDDWIKDDFAPRS